MVNTREIASEYRMAHWAGIIKERAESDLTVKAYCETAGVHPNSYFYWQRKLREAACAKMSETATFAVPCGWTAVAPAVVNDSGMLSVEIEKFRCDGSQRLAVLEHACRSQGEFSISFDHGNRQGERPAPVPLYGIPA